MLAVVVSAMPSTPRSTNAPTGIGLGLRWEFIDDVDAGWTCPQLAFFEVAPENYMRRGGCFPAALGRIAERHRLLTHGLMLDIGGADALDADYLARLRGFLTRFGGERHTDHLCWTRRNGHYLHDLLPLRLSSAAARHVAERVARVQDAIGMPLALENISYYGACVDGLSERDFVCEVLERADCSMLLDVNNVYVNAQNHGFDPIAYLEGLPLDRVVQLHVAGGERKSHLHDMIIDTHGTDVSPEVASLMAWVIERTGPLPVLYERDHDIPPVDELARQVAALDGVYREALARRDRVIGADPRGTDDRGDNRGSARGEGARGRVGPSGDGRPSSSADDARSGAECLAGYQVGVSRVITSRGDATTDPESLARELAGQAELSAEDRQAVAGMGAPALYVYRRLVRGTLTSVIDTFLSRTQARFGDAFSLWVDRWLERKGATSPYLAHVPMAFLDWAEPRWRADPDIAAYLPDLARHELTEFEVGMVPDDSEARVGDGAFALDSRLVLTPTLRLRSYAYAVHELPRGDDDRTVPQLRDTLLLCYRDVEHEVRYMSLSPVAMAFVRHLRSGDTLEAGLRSACRESGEALDDALLVRMSQLLADLAERKVVLGVARVSHS